MATTSGYTHCACRDCFEIVVSDDMSSPDFCEDCLAAGCEPDSECCSPHAYGGCDLAASLAEAHARLGDLLAAAELEAPSLAKRCAEARQRLTRLQIGRLAEDLDEAS